MAQFYSWGAQEQNFVIRHLCKSPPSCAKICEKHHKEAQRYHSNENYVPKWKQQSKGHMPQIECMYPECKTTSNIMIKALFAPKEIIKEITDIQTHRDESIYLCRAHYNEVYKCACNPSTKCASCDASPKEGTKFTHHSPDACTVSSYISDDDNGREILPDDVLCIACYKAHQSLLAEIETIPEYINKCLYDDMKFWAEVQKEPSTDPPLTNAILETVIFVAKQLYQEKALLLSTACSVFLETYTGQNIMCSISSIEVIINCEDGTTKFTSRWLLSRLVLHLNKYMRFKCMHKKFGTVLYKRDGDLLTSLSWALGANNYKQDYLFQHQESRQTCPPIESQPDTLILHSGLLFNDLLHKEINQLSCTADPSNLSIDQFLTSVDSRLTDFLSIATQTVREQHSKRLTPQSDIASHNKKVRHFFLLCQMMYCTN